MPVQQIEPRFLGQPSHILVNDEKESEYEKMSEQLYKNYTARLSVFAKGENSSRTTVHTSDKRRLIFHS